MIGHRWELADVVDGPACGSCRCYRRLNDGPGDAVAARAALSVLDLTSLNDDDDEARIAELCERAVTPFGPVAAVCVCPPFAGLARHLLTGTPVRIAAVANFPDGDAKIERAVREATDAAADGAAEIEVVFPYRAALAGDHALAGALIGACRRALGDDVTLKVILETGLLPDAATIARCAHVAVSEGADFLKTSTGKRGPGASLTAIALFCEAIRCEDRLLGCKASGGIRTVAEAAPYIDLVSRLLGPDAVAPERLRIGASSLLDDVLTILAGGRSADMVGCETGY